MLAFSLPRFRGTVWALKNAARCDWRISRIIGLLKQDHIFSQLLYLNGHVAQPGIGILDPFNAASNILKS